MRYQHIRFFVLFSLVLVAMPLVTFAVTQADIEASEQELRRQLKEIEAEIAEQEGILAKRQQESASLARDVAILDAEIQKARLSMEQRDLYIRQLSGQIAGKADTIDELNAKIVRQKESLARLVRRTNEIESVSLAEVVLGQPNFSSFFSELDEFASVEIALEDSFDQVRGTRTETQEEKTSLEGTRAEEKQLLSIQELQKQQLEAREAEKADLLTLSRGIEAQYQKVLASKQRTAAEIRTRLFRLQGTGPIPFGDAVVLATRAEERTGVRAALILGVIRQESELGQNIGQCNLPDDPPKYKWQNVMKPSRDREPYLSITSRLGLDPDLMPLSCPQAGGWGGAMGPAQFIPSTWVLFEDRIAQLTGHKPPNPWDPEDAFMASALLLSDNGADRGTYAAERLAALRYFAGWANAEVPAYAFYGDSVMSYATSFQKDIDLLERG